MKRLDLVLLSLGLLALVATPAAADCRAIHRCATPVVVQSPVAVVETIPIVPVVSAFLQPQVIAYGAAYAGAPFQQQGYAPQQGYAQQSGQQDAVLAALQRLEQRLGAMEQRSGAAPQAPAVPMPAADAPPVPAQEQALPAQGQAGADVVKLFTSRCASCHAKGKEGSGGGFVLLDGPRLAPLTADKQREVLRQIYSQKMPKSGKPLSVEELGVVVGWIATN